MDKKGAALRGSVFLRGSIIAVIVTIPSLAAFGASWAILDDVFQAALVGGVVHFISMIFSFKISKKLFSNSS